MEHVTESTHPSAEKLRTFGLGQLDEAESSAVEEHVSRCAACCRALAAVGPDPFTDLLRSSRLSPPTIPVSEIVTQVYAAAGPPSAERRRPPASAPPALEPFAVGAAAGSLAPSSRSRRQAAIIPEVLPVRPRRGRRWAMAVALLLLALVGTIVAGIVYRIQTDNGELVISTDNPDVEVVIKQNGKLVRIIDTKTNKEVELHSGLYDLELGGGAEGLKLSLDKVTIHRGETVVATVTRTKKDTGAAAPSPPPPKPEVLYRIPWQDESQGFPAFIWQTSLSADGRLFLGAGDTGFKGNVRVFEVATGKLVQEFVLDEDTTGQMPYVNTARFVPGGKYVAVTYAVRKDIYLWDLATGKLARKFVGHGEADPRCAVSPDGKRLLSWGDDKTVRLWDVETGKELRKLEGHTDKAAGVFSPGGKQVLTFSPDRTLRLWDVDRGKELKKLEGHTDACIGCFSPDGKQVLSYGADGAVRLWDLGTGKEVRRFEGPKAGVVSAYFVANGRLAVARGEEHTDPKLRVWEVAGGKLVREIDYDAAEYGINHWTMTASPDGRLALVSVKNDSSVRVLDLSSGQEVHRFDDCPGARAWSFSPDGSLAVAGSFRAGMYVFRLPAPPPRAK